MTASAEETRTTVEAIAAEVADAEWRRRGSHEVMAIRYEDLARLCAEAARRATLVAGGAA